MENKSNKRTFLVTGMIPEGVQVEEINFSLHDKSWSTDWSRSMEEVTHQMEDFNADIFDGRCSIKSTPINNHIDVSLPTIVQSVSVEERYITKEGVSPTPLGNGCVRVFSVYARMLDKSVNHLGDFSDFDTAVHFQRMLIEFSKVIFNTPKATR